MSLGFAPDGKRRRRTVRGRTKTEIRDKLRELREDIASNVRNPASYSVRQAVDDWLRDRLDCRSAATVTKYQYVLKPVLERVSHAALRQLAAQAVVAVSATCSVVLAGVALIRLFARMPGPV